MVKLYGLKSKEVEKRDDKRKIFNEDSTPVEASRYDKYAKRNKHYGVKMYKAHIIMFETVPLYMSFTEGERHDNPESLKNMQVLADLGIKADIMNKDGGYHSFQNHADTWSKLEAKPNLSLPVNSVIEKRGMENQINHWACVKHFK